MIPIKSSRLWAEDKSMGDLNKEIKSKPQAEKSSNTRRYSRAQYDCGLIVHNQKMTMKGISVEIGAGGAGLVLESDHIQPGQILLIHFQPGGGVPPFNAVCKVVSKLPKAKTADSTSTKYGVSFTSISSEIRSRINHFASETQKAAA